MIYYTGRLGHFQCSLVLKAQQELGGRIDRRRLREIELKNYPGGAIPSGIWASSDQGIGREKVVCIRERERTREGKRENE